MKKAILASKEAEDEQLLKSKDVAETNEALLKRLQKLQQRVEKQEKLISELKWKVDELYSKYEAEHDPYFYD